MSRILTEPQLAAIRLAADRARIGWENYEQYVEELEAALDANPHGNVSDIVSDFVGKVITFDEMLRRLELIQP